MLHSIVQITSIHFLPTFILINLKTESAISSTPVINSKQWPIQYIFKSLFSQNLSCLLVLLSFSDFLCIFQTLYRLLCLLELFQNEPNIELVFSHKTLFYNLLTSNFSAIRPFLIIMQFLLAWGYLPA